MRHVLLLSVIAAAGAAIYVASGTSSSSPSGEGSSEPSTLRLPCCPSSGASLAEVQRNDGEPPAGALFSTAFADGEVDAEKTKVDAEKKTKVDAEKKTEPGSGHESEPKAEVAKTDDEPSEPEVEIDPALGILEGRIVLEGDPPKLEPVEVPPNHQDRAFCVGHVKDERLILGKDRGIKNVVVSVEGYRPRKPPERRTVRLDNKNCLFVPHVIATTVGSKLELTNSDSFIHNSHGLLPPLQGINSAIPPKNAGKVEKRLRRPGWGVMKCDFHPWMRADIHVFAHELFAVSKKDGTFRIVNIPPGKHEIRLWQEVLEPRGKTVEVEIEAGKTTRLDVSLEAKKR